MAEDYMKMPRVRRIEALLQAAQATKLRESVLEKDIWCVWCLQVLYGSEIGMPLVFKGGTSLSKAFNAIQRYSEDIDLTYDIRQIAPDIVGDAPGALPANPSQKRSWDSKVRKRLEKWVAEEAAPLVRKALAEIEVGGEVHVEDSVIYVRYEPLTKSPAYVRQEVKLEFLGRSTGEPNKPITVGCYADPHLEGVKFPSATPRVMAVERTFWEKATAAHVYCRQHRLRGDRFARHWYDLVQLDGAGHVEDAIADSAQGLAVAAHKSSFYPEKDHKKKKIDYRAAVTGGLQLVPTNKESRQALADDYDDMVEASMLFGEPLTFDEIMERCEDIEHRTNIACGS